MIRFFHSILILSITLFVNASVTSAQSETNAAMITDLRNFLFDASARRDFAHGKTEATASNNFLEIFPPWAQNELLEIVMQVASDSLLGSDKHVTAYQNGGAQAAKQSFSPAVQARIDQLLQKLLADPKFNTPENLQRMKQRMPNLGMGQG